MRTDSGEVEGLHGEGDPNGRLRFGEERRSEEAVKGRPSESGEPDPVRQVFGELSALSEYVRHLAAVEADLIRLRVRSLLVRVGLGIAAAVAAGVLIVAGVLYLVRGAAEGISALLGSQPWVGRLVVGVLVLLVVLVIPFLRMGARQRQERNEKYETRKAATRKRHRCADER